MHRYITIKNYEIINSALLLLNNDLSVSEFRTEWENQTEQFRRKVFLKINDILSQKINNYSESERQIITQLSQVQPHQKLSDSFLKMLYDFFQFNTSFSCAETDTRSLAFIKHTPNLILFSCSDNPLVNLSGIENLKQLKFLYCINCGLKEIDALSTLENLTELYIGLNSITDLSPLLPLRNLKLLNCLKNDINRNSIMAFKKAMPHCTVRG